MSVESTSTTSTVAPSSTTTSAVAVDTGDLAGFELAQVMLGDTTLLVALAASNSQRAQGLMFVEDLGDLDGMLFVFSIDVTSAFWMKNTLLPLDIAFFDAGGILVDRLEMVPCEADPCPRYQAAGPYRFALEAPSGTVLSSLEPTDRLQVEDLVP